MKQSNDKDISNRWEWDRAVNNKEYESCTPSREEAGKKYKDAVVTLSARSKKKHPGTESQGFSLQVCPFFNTSFIFMKNKNCIDTYQVYSERVTTRLKQADDKADGYSRYSRLPRPMAKGER